MKWNAALRTGQAVTIDEGAKYKFSGARATPERKDFSTQGPTTTKGAAPCYLFRL